MRNGERPVTSRILEAPWNAVSVCVRMRDCVRVRSGRRYPGVCRKRPPACSLSFFFLALELQNNAWGVAASLISLCVCCPSKKAAILIQSGDGGARKK